MEFSLKYLPSLGPVAICFWSTHGLVEGRVEVDGGGELELGEGGSEWWGELELGVTAIPNSSLGAPCCEAMNPTHTLSELPAQLYQWPCLVSSLPK